MYPHFPELLSYFDKKLKCQPHSIVMLEERVICTYPHGAVNIFSNCAAIHQIVVSIVNSLVALKERSVDHQSW